MQIKGKAECVYISWQERIICDRCHRSRLALRIPLILEACRQAAKVVEGERNRTMHTGGVKQHLIKLRGGREGTVTVRFKDFIFYERLELFSVQHPHPTLACPTHEFLSRLILFFFLIPAILFVTYFRLPSVVSKEPYPLHILPPPYLFLQCRLFLDFFTGHQ